MTWVSYTIVAIGGLSISYRAITTLIKKYHPKRYDEIKTQLKYFFLFETIPLGLSLIYRIIELVN